jgi:hypothetical protein
MRGQHHPLEQRFVPALNKGGVAKTARRLPAKQIIGSAILSAASNLW